jgi:sporulation protein YlmC with PRC-barrel domain
MKIKFRKKLMVAAMLSSLGAGIPVTALAQTAAKPAPSGQPAQAQAPSRDMRASQLMGKQVTNAQGENLGKIEDLIVDADSERVRYGVVSFGGFLGLGDKLFVIPVGSFGAGAQQDQLVLNIDKERLKKAPGLDRNKRPDFGKDSWRREVDRFYFTENKTGQPSAGARLMSAKDLIGTKVNDRAAHNAGKIADVVVNFGNGRAYTVLDFDKAWSPDDKLLPLPFSAYHFPSRPDLDILLSVDRPKLDMARGFDTDKWPDLNAPNYQQQINNHLLSFQTQSKENPQATTTGREPVTSGSSR